MRFVFLLLAPLFVLASPLTEQILSQMSLEEKIGQLFVAPICPLEDEHHRTKWLELFEKFHIGNAIVKQSDPENQIECLNWLQENSKHPLLILSDAEWGLGMRMTKAISYPKNMALGAIQDQSLLERFGKEIARQARLVGIHMNLAPVLDVNSNPKNPIIHLRSFGDDFGAVAERGARVIRGMREGGIYTCAKHFPGHGDTNIDSHRGLPIIHRFTEELTPFKRAIDEGATAVMTGHILVPRFDPNLPATLSYPITTSLLREQLGFSGLVVTDALNMKALVNRFSFEEIALKAHMAGADLLLYGDHISSEVDSLLEDQIPRAYRALLEFYRNQPLDQLDTSLRRILEAKEEMGLFDVRTVEKSSNLNTPEALDLKETLFAEAITQLGGDFAPIDANTAYLSIGHKEEDILKQAFKNCVNPTRIVVSIRNINHNQKNFGLTEEDLALCRECISNYDVLFCLFGSPYAVSLFPQGAKILVAYEDERAAERAVLRILKGEMPPKGRLPIKF